MNRPSISKKEEQRIFTLKNAIQKGLNSGTPHDFNAQKLLACLKKKKTS